MCSGALALTAACGGSSKPAPVSGRSSSTTSTTASTSPSTTPWTPATPDPTAAADTEALGVYKSTINALTKAMTTNQLDVELSKYATGAAFVTFSQAVSSDINHNIIYVGAPQSSPKVTATDLTANPKIVTITDCFGGPHFTPVFAADDQAGHKKGQSAVGPGQSTAPHPLTVQVVNRTGTWQVEEYTPNGSATC